VSAWTVTIRHGPEVERVRCDDLKAALDAARHAVARVQAEGGLEEISALRDFGPEQRVDARIEISSPGFFRGRDAGVDVMGDGSLVAYAGVVRKRQLEPGGSESVYDALRKALSG
jgi:hypothetical protein